MLIGPVFGVKVIDGPLTVTVKAAVAISPVDPLTVTAYTPGKAVAATVNPVPVNLPVESIAHVAEAIMIGAAGTCPKTQRPASAGLKLAPDANT